ncbi:CD82 antigen-like [Copidosoma floridanum]|uniref:CD82 antigen-like n=1 Tax=Copidosoma floridanum TaxID=29053 RepID=UPI0006C99B8D|nr:CD82 antigen-like [Copidosoma floridanum]
MKYLKATLFSLNLLIWLAGCTVTVIGIWLLIDPYKGHIINLFTPNSTPHESIYYVGYFFLGLGLIIFIVGFFGCRTAIYESQYVIITYMTLLIALIVTETITAAILGVMAYRVLTGLETRFAGRLAEHYGHDASNDLGFTQSLDFAQYKFNCCGIYSDEDFNGTIWWRENQISGMRRQVPLTCCVFKDIEVKNTGSPMSVISRVFYKNNETPWLYPRPKDETACQSKNISVHTDFRHKEGCLEKVRSWLKYESTALIIFGVVAASAQPNLQEKIPEIASNMAILGKSDYSAFGATISRWRTVTKKKNGITDTLLLQVMTICGNVDVKSTIYVKFVARRDLIEAASVSTACTHLQ